MEPLRIRFLGTGTAFHGDGRGSQCLCIEPGAGASIAVDLGPTAARAMSRYGVEPDHLDAVVFTHLHGDHIAGWPFLLLNLVILARRTRPLEVYGPVGLRERLEGLVALCFEDALRCPAFELRYHEWAVEVREGDAIGGGVMLDRYPVKHHASSVGLRLHVGGLRVGISGDTGWCEGLERLTAGNDVSIVECTTPRPVSETHLSLEEIRRGRERLGSSELLLVHLGDDVADELAVNPIRGVIAANDGMVWTPPGSAPGSP